MKGAYKMNPRLIIVLLILLYISARKWIFVQSNLSLTFEIYKTYTIEIFFVEERYNILNCDGKPGRKNCVHQDFCKNLPLLQVINI